MSPSRRADLAAYRFIGGSPTHFPDMVLIDEESGDWVGAVLQPGVVVRLLGAVEHPLLVPLDGDVDLRRARAGKMLDRPRLAPSPLTTTPEGQSGEDNITEESRPAPSAGDDDPKEQDL